MKNRSTLIICIVLFVHANVFGQTHKLKGLWINTQYKLFKEAKNQELPINCIPQYIEIDSTGNLLLINFEHLFDLGLPKKIVRYGPVEQFIYRKKITFYITEIRDTNAFILLQINQNVLGVLFEKIESPPY